MTTPQTPGSPSSAVGERERFEAWAPKARLSLALHTAPEGFYLDAHTQAAWLAWQAAISEPAAEQQADYGSVMKWLDANCKKVAWSMESATFEISDEEAFALVTSFLAAPVVQAAEQQTGVPGDYPAMPNAALDKWMEDHNLIGSARASLTLAVLYAIDADRAQQVGAGLGEPVGTAGKMPGTDGFTMACFHADAVPLGMKLYTADALRAKVEPSDAEIDSLDTYALHVMAPRGRESVRAFARAILALQGAKLADAHAPAGQVLVPVEFIQGFNTLAHNWSLEAIPPFFYSGTEGDAFKRAFREAGQELGKLKPLLAAAPIEAKAQKGGADHG